MQTHAQALEPLAQHTVRAARWGTIEARELTNMAYGVALTEMAQPLGMLFTVFTKAAEQRLSGFQPQHVANTAWAFATVNYRDGKLFAAMAIAV